MLSDSQKDYVFKLAMEAAQHRAMTGDCEADVVEAAKVVVAAAKAAVKKLDTEDSITVNVTINAKGVSIDSK